MMVSRLTSSAAGCATVTVALAVGATAGNAPALGGAAAGRAVDIGGGATARGDVAGFAGFAGLVGPHAAVALPSVQARTSPHARTPAPDERERA
jgi:hypothetical protein